MTVNLTEHAEAILRAAGLSGTSFAFLAGHDPETQTAILAACAALFDAAAESAKEAGEDSVRHFYDVGQIDEGSAGYLIHAIRSIDPASLRSDA